MVLREEHNTQFRRGDLSQTGVVMWRENVVKLVQIIDCAYLLNFRHSFKEDESDGGTVGLTAILSATRLQAISDERHDLLSVAAPLVTSKDSPVQKSQPKWCYQYHCL